MPKIDLNQQNLNEVCQILQTHVPNYSVWAFGSRVNGKAKIYSDLDLAIITQQPLSLSKMAQLKEAFDESNLPIRVDVVDWGATSEEFQKIILQNKVLIKEGFDTLQVANKLKSQRGAVLAFSLVMLLLLTLAATRMIQQNKQQLEMANSVRLLTQEFANAEGILAEAKNMINYHPSHDNCLPNDPRSCADHSYFILDSSGDPYTGTDGKEHYKYKLPINDSRHRCTPTLPPFSVPFKQNALLAGKDLFKDTPILKETSNDGVPRAIILKVRCQSNTGIEQVCSTYNATANTVKCNPKSGDVDCTSTTVIDDVNIAKFNSSDDICYQSYDPQSDDRNTACDGSSSQPLWCTSSNANCVKEIYTIQVISTDANGTTRQIISDHVVGCG